MFESERCQKCKNLNRCMSMQYGEEPVIIPIPENIPNFPQINEIVETQPIDLNIGKEVFMKEFDSISLSDYLTSGISHQRKFDI